MPTHSSSTVEPDPLKAVADAMDAAVEAAKAGADRARLAAGGALPAAGQFLSRAIYKTSYAVSYGVVMPAAMIALLIPKDNAAVHGLVDGARAAMDAMRESKADAVSEPTP